MCGGELRKITERVEKLESNMFRLSALISSVMSWFSRRRKANAVSRHLSGPEAIQFKARMAAHGVPDEEDDESRNRKKEAAR